MKRTNALVVVVSLIALAVSACGGSSPSPSSPSPSPTPTPTPIPTPTVGILTGVVSANGGGRLSGATVTILDGANAGRSDVGQRRLSV